MAKTKTLKPLLIYVDDITRARVDTDCANLKMSRRQWLTKAIADRDAISAAARRLERELAEVQAHVN